MRTHTPKFLAPFAVLIAVLLPSGPALPAADGGTWLEPRVLGLGGADARMDVNGRGDTVVSWTAEGSVMVAYRPAGRDWQRPVAVTSEEPNGTRVVGAFVHDDGTATVAWWRGGEQVLVADGGAIAWRIDDRVGGGLTCCSMGEPLVEADEVGNLLITWEEFNDQVGTSHVWQWRDTRGRWSDGGSAGGSYRYAATFRDGVATVIRGLDDLSMQSGRVGDEMSTWERIWAGGNFSAPVTAENEHGDLALAVLHRPEDPDGVMNPGDTGQLLVLTRRSGGRWTEAYRSQQGQELLHPAVSINDSGRVLVAYLDTGDTQIHVRTGAVGESLGQSHVLGTGADTRAPSAALSASGEAVVVWAAEPEEGQADQPVNAAVMQASGRWAASTRIGSQSATPSWGERTPTVAVSPKGMFTALIFDGHRLRVTDFTDDGTGPTTRIVAPRGDYVASLSVPVRWAVRDELSRPDRHDVRVRVADRTGDLGRWRTWIAETSRTRARYDARQGRTYCFAARSRDHAGNQGDWSPRRCVTTPLDDRRMHRATNGWKQVRGRHAFQDTMTATNETGQRLRVPPVRANKLRLLVQTCPRCGSVVVEHAGRRLGSFELTSTRTRNKALLLADYRRSRTGAVVVRTQGDKPVRIDGLIAGR